MTAPQTIDRATDGGPESAALRLFTRHQRRLGAGPPRCGFCRGAWHPRGARARLVDGCAARQLAAAALARLFAAAPTSASPVARGAADARS